MGNSKDLQPGVKTTVYTNFVTEEFIEGNAILIRRMSDHDHGVVDGHPVEWWLVRFPDGAKVSRFIVNKSRKI